jgi:5-methylcytosine-specific restriction enzyme subunit McrC
VSKVLRVTEYGSIRCADTFSAADRTVTASQFHQLERFNERFEKRRKVTVFRYGARRTLVAQNFVGVIHLGPYQVEVLPKIEADEHKVRQNLLQMVANTLDLKLQGGVLGLLERTDHSILEVLIRLYCDLLWEALHKGMVRRYESQQENLVVLRGRLNIAHQLRHNIARPDRLHCTFDEFSQDNELNRVLKASLRILLVLSKTEASSRSIAELLFCFGEVADRPASSIRWELASTDRLNQRYAPLLRMARMFIEGASPDLTAGASDGFAILFDMNELFEEYIGRQVKRMQAQSGIRTVLQGPRHYLARRASGAQCFQMRPDIVVLKPDTPPIIVDTKWKRLKQNGTKEAISTADLYQMFAYSQSYNAKSVILLYPHNQELGDWKACRNRYYFENKSGGQGQQVLHIATVQLNDLKLVQTQLQSIFLSTLSNS